MRLFLNLPSLPQINHAFIFMIVTNNFAFLFIVLIPEKINMCALYVNSIILIIPLYWLL